MKLTIKLSEGSVNTAIRKLENILNDLDQDTSDCVDILLMESADVANGYYGNMAHAWPHKDQNKADGTVAGHIGVSGKEEASPLIAEFGAGDAVVKDYGFENAEPVPIFGGSYSLLVGTHEYYDYGVWKWHGQLFNEVKPRQGLLRAKEFLLANGNTIAREVILHDRY